MSAAATNAVAKQMIPLLGMMWRGMWGATAATAAAQVMSAEASGDNADDDLV